MEKIAAVHDTMLCGVRLCDGTVIWEDMETMEFSVPNQCQSWHVFYNMFVHLCQEYDLHYSVCGKDFKVSCHKIS